jgi:SRSO17 transposase
MVKPRQPDSTWKLIDEYCRYYRNLFSEVRSFEAFTQLHAGIISDIKRAMGFEIDCVLADSLYGESTSTFIGCLQKLNLQLALCDSE